MPTNSADLANKTFAVLSKDLRLELRTKYALNTILMFGVTTLTMVSFSVGQSALPSKLLAALFWIIMFFSAMAALAQVFTREEESGTALTLKLTADPTAVFLGKFMFNLALMSLLSVIITPLFFMFTDAPTDNLASFALVLLLGVIALCTATTLVAAIISKSSVRGALFAVLCFPILMLPLMMLVMATDKVLSGQPLADLASSFQGLIAYSVIMITASLMLFKFVWRE